MNERYTVNGKGSYSLEEATVRANRIFKQSGDIVAIEAIPKYNVIALLDVGHALLRSRQNKTEWSKRTAIKHAKTYKERHGKDCLVIEASEPIHTAIPVFKTF